MIPEIGDRVCDLECVRDAAGKTHEFVGPVKIVLMETPPGEYTRREWVAAIIMAAYYMMGAINVTAMYYTLIWWRTLYNHLHVILCTSCFTFLVPTAVLFHHPLSGAGGVLKPQDRTRAHWILQFVSGIFLGAGIYAISKESALNAKNTHTFISFLAAFCLYSNMIVGIITNFLQWRLFKWIHRIVGVAALIFGGASFITGMLEIKPLFTFNLPISIPLPFLSPFMGFHLFSAEAILALNYINFWAVVLRSKHRIIVHIVLQLFAFVCGTVGSTLVLYERGVTLSFHFISSSIALVLGILTLILGIFALTTSYYGRPVHVIFGILTFITASVSLISGIISKPFMATFNPSIVYTLIGFIVYYTSFLCITSFVKCLERI